MYFGGLVYSCFFLVFQGVEPERCPSFSNALKAGTPVFTPTTPSIADGLTVPTVGCNAVATALPLIDKMVQVCTFNHFKIIGYRISITNLQQNYRMSSSRPCSIADGLTVTSVHCNVVATALTLIDRMVQFCTFNHLE